jgi:hypothetical protein
VAENAELLGVSGVVGIVGVLKFTGAHRNGRSQNKLKTIKQKENKSAAENAELLGVSGVVGASNFSRITESVTQGVEFIKPEKPRKEKSRENQYML